MKHPLDIISFSRLLMRELIYHQIPVRMGIGFGTLVIIGFKSETSLAGEDHAANFFGPAVTRAHAAEHCGIKGMRILVHDSAFFELSRNDDGSQHYYRDHLIECDPDETRHLNGVSHEVDFVTRAEHPDLVLERIRRMAARAPDEAQHHYTATLAALDRMIKEKRYE